MTSSIERTAGEYFDARAAYYDEHARLGIPRYDEMIARVVECVPEEVGSALELGCGTGALTSALLGRFPDVALHAMDASTAMTKIARHRIELQHPKATVYFDVADFESMPVANERYDLITSCMALHHLPDKAPLYTRLHASLRPNGHLVFADELCGALPHIEALHYQSWLDFARQPGHISESDLAETLRHVEEQDHYETLPRQLELLASAGFRQVDCTWRNLNYAVFAAVR